MLLEMASEAMGERLAVGGRAEGVSYEELLDRARRTAAVLTASGAERVGFVDVNSVAAPAGPVRQPGSPGCRSRR